MVPEDGATQKGTTNTPWMSLLGFFCGMAIYLLGVPGCCRVRNRSKYSTD
jgi:hypothetical protein